jgi:sugar phosphate isomerase/epimerase
LTSPLLLHSVSYAGLWGQAFLSPEECVARAATLGFDGVMLMAKRPHVSVSLSSADRVRLRSVIEKQKLSTVVLAGYCNLSGDLEHSDIPHAEIHTAYLTELARLTRDLGGSILRVFTGYESAAAPLARQWSLIVVTLREAAERAQEFGVTLAVQNHHDIACDWRAMRDLLTQVNHPNCRAAFDAWAPALQQTDLQEAAVSMAPHMVHTTVADYQLRPRFRYRPDLVHYERETPYTIAVPMGQGFIDYPAFLSGLRKGGYAGGIAYEMCSPLREGGELDTLDRYAHHFIEYLRTL